MAIHFVADLNFNGVCARHAHPYGFADCGEMTRRICETWRSRVAPTDTVWILGNVGNPVHLASLPGTKHLVRGATDPQPWNCLATGRYASVSDMQRLDTPYGDVVLVSDPTTILTEMDALVLHGRCRAMFDRPGFTCIAADRTGWGPVRLEDLLGSTTAVRQAA